MHKNRPGQCEEVGGTNRIAYRTRGPPVQFLADLLLACILNANMHTSSAKCKIGIFVKETQPFRNQRLIFS